MRNQLPTKAWNMQLRGILVEEQNPWDSPTSKIPKVGRVEIKKCKKRRILWNLNFWISQKKCSEYAACAITQNYPHLTSDLRIVPASHWLTIHQIFWKILKSQQGGGGRARIYFGTRQNTSGGFFWDQKRHFGPQRIGYTLQGQIKAPNQQKTLVWFCNGTWGMFWTITHNFQDTYIKA